MIARTLLVKWKDDALEWIDAPAYTEELKKEKMQLAPIGNDIALPPLPGVLGNHGRTQATVLPIRALRS